MPWAWVGAAVKQFLMFFYYLLKLSTTWCEIDFSFAFGRPGTYWSGQDLGQFLVQQNEEPHMWFARRYHSGTEECLTLPLRRPWAWPEPFWRCPCRFLPPAKLSSFFFCHVEFLILCPLMSAKINFVTECAGKGCRVHTAFEDSDQWQIAKFLSWHYLFGTFSSKTYNECHLSDLLCIICQF